MGDVVWFAGILAANLYLLPPKSRNVNRRLPQGAQNLSMMKTKLFVIAIVLSISAMRLSAQFAPVKEGDMSPDVAFVLADDTNEVRLSDLHGKMVLVDFWAAWCKPCRRENPNLVAVYEKFKDAKFSNGEEGFEIISVSLDMNDELWRTALADDGLNWPYHVCDFLGWHSNYALAYGVRSIPASYLIDGEGRVVGINLRGDKLESALNKRKRRMSLFGRSD